MSKINKKLDKTSKSNYKDDARQTTDVALTDSLLRKDMARLEKDNFKRAINGANSLINLLEQLKSTQKSK